MSNYQQDLKSFRWERKRKEILERDEYACRVCKSKNELEVHHLYYLPGYSPWDYDDEAMVTVCKKHHQQLTWDLVKTAGFAAFHLLCENFVELDILFEWRSSTYFQQLKEASNSENCGSCCNCSNSCSDLVFVPIPYHFNNYPQQFKPEDIFPFCPTCNTIRFNIIETEYRDWILTKTKDAYMISKGKDPNIEEY